MTQTNLEVEKQAIRGYVERRECAFCGVHGSPQVLFWLCTRCYSERYRCRHCNNGLRDHMGPPTFKCFYEVKRYVTKGSFLWIDAALQMIEDGELPMHPVTP